MKVALIGLDGSGKTSNIEIIKTDIDFSRFNFIWVRWKPILLFPLYKILHITINHKFSCKNSYKTNLMQNAMKKNAIKEKIFKNVIIRAIWMHCALIDYIIQFYFKSGSFIVKKKDIIFDRFYIDLFIDQGINFGYSPEKVITNINRYRWLFPKISKYIYIRVSPEICIKRKDDIPNIDYLMTRYSIYELLSKDSSWIVVDGEDTFSNVNSKIRKFILDRANI